MKRTSFDFFERLNQFGKTKTPFVFLIDFQQKMPIVFPLSEVKPNQLLFDFNGFRNTESIQKFYRKKSTEIRLEKFPVSFSTYEKSFQIVQEHLRYGNSYLVNLTFPTSIKINADLKTIFHQTQAKYKVWFQGEWVCFSPETFIQIRENKIRTFPMKGTIKSSLPNAYEQILKDTKEFAEHATIVDLLRNDLSQIAENVRVKRFRYGDEISTDSGENLLQISSEITGKLSSNYAEDIGTILQKLLPAGSISGAPKPKTMTIIEEAEIYERGFYTGIAGYFDGKNLDTGVLIRFIEKTPDGLIFKSGGGITAQSDARKEYQELLDKVYLPFKKY